MKKIYAFCLFAALAVAGGCEESDSGSNIAGRFDPLFAQELHKRGYVADASRITSGEVATITKLDLSGGSVEHGELVSLEGIEYFTSLVELDCSYNRLASLNVSRNKKLEILICGYNRLTALDLSQNAALKDLFCRGNELTAIDLSQNPALEVLWCGENRLEALDVSSHSALTELSCGNNLLTSLDVSKNTVLMDLSCRGNRLASLDLSHNPALTELYCSDNLLTSMDISGNRSLFYFDCRNNPGDGSLFPVTAWFDNASVPGKVDGADPDKGDEGGEDGNYPTGIFTTGSWEYAGATVTVDYRKAE